jgi:hypothetical protein
MAVVMRFSVAVEGKPNGENKIKKIRFKVKHFIRTNRIEWY